jgi:hypothetical protein
MNLFICPYLDSEIELSDDRLNHIAIRHPDLIPSHLDKIGETLSDPDNVRLSTRAKNAKLFSRWYNDISGGQYVVIVVITSSEPVQKNWIITAYLTKKLAEGEIEWERS